MTIYIFIHLYSCEISLVSVAVHAASEVINSKTLARRHPYPGILITMMHLMPSHSGSYSQNTIHD